jgi:hypothetical protein
MKVARETARAPRKNFIPVRGGSVGAAVEEGISPPRSMSMKYLISQINAVKKTAQLRKDRERV